MNGITVEAAVEHLSGILSWYLSSDLDSFSREGIAETIRALEAFSDRYSDEDDLSILLGLISNLLSDLYVARGYATSEVPRARDYYQSMNNARYLIRQIRSLR